MKRSTSTRRYPETWGLAAILVASTLMAGEQASAQVDDQPSDHMSVPAELNDSQEARELERLRFWLSSFHEVPFLVVTKDNIDEFWAKKKEMAELGKQD